APILMWTWLERPIRLLAVGGMQGIKRAGQLCMALPNRGFLHRTGMLWGILLCLAFFLPWMIGVAEHIPYAWKLWDYEYVSRLRGVYPGAPRHNNVVYFVPILLGLVAPWTPLTIISLAAPFQRDYQRRRRPLV